jgi:hypothetical protein
MPFKGGRRTSFDGRTVVREPDPISPESLDPVDETGLYVIYTGDYDEMVITKIVRATGTEVRKHCEYYNINRLDSDCIYWDGPHEIEEI